MENNKQREKMRLKGLIRFYKPYLNIFLADMLFAIIAAGVTLVVPLIVRHITSTVVHLPMEEAFDQIMQSYVEEREKLGYAELLEESTRRMIENKERLGIQ